MQDLIKRLNALPTRDCDATSLQRLSDAALDKLREIKRKELIRDANARIQTASMDTTTNYSTYTDAFKKRFERHPYRRNGFVKIKCSPFDDAELTKFLRSIKVHDIIDPSHPLFWKLNFDYQNEYSSKVDCIYDEDSSIMADFSIGYSSEDILSAIDNGIWIEEGILEIISDFADNELRIQILTECMQFKTKDSEFVLQAYDTDNSETIQEMRRSIPLLTIIPSLFAIIDNVPFDIPWSWWENDIYGNRRDWDMADRQDVQINWQTGKVKSRWKVLS